MSKYVLYVDVGNLPFEKAKAYTERMSRDTRASGFLNVSDDLLVIPRRNAPTEFVKIE